ncbi:TrkA family potassium uptake protein [Dermabacter sp. p3-SID358]|uniref:potassium channel family protein n=1 Tax=Dermabacter sp. p3-SID358 TaxID=2916114 RepID=UPI0021A893D5|nr:TrkA family potassium uptake protein [Dermabacter sp. p3-SID358]MCT1866161.1 TrkA family potassium uptake protein [Dermabacter sp. p3-SID358]
MKIVIVGAGSVGRSIARELLDKGRTVTLIDREEAHPGLDGVTWVQGDAAELDVLEQARLSEADVVVAATGDDKANLVVSLLAKTEFGVPRTVGRVNHPRNEWMFDDAWGVDVAVSTPRIMTSLVEEAVSVGTVVTMFSFAKSETNMVEITVPETSPIVGKSIGDVAWPRSATLVGVVREGHPRPPAEAEALEARDELLFLAHRSCLTALQRTVVPRGLEETTAALPVVRDTGEDED